ncbi:MAG TPA: hypothetical protein VIX80_07730 [Candidatus Kapabacteria bacterium]
MNRKIIIMLVLAGSFGAGMGYAQSPTKAADAESPSSAQTVKKDAVPNDAKKDELSKKLLQRKMQLDNERLKPAETVQPNTRSKETKPVDKPKGDKK